MSVLKYHSSRVQQYLDDHLQCFRWEHWLQAYCITLDADAGVSHPLSHSLPWLGHTP